MKLLDDVEQLCNEFDENGNICFKHCSKRKINKLGLSWAKLSSSWD